MVVQKQNVLRRGRSGALCMYGEEQVSSVRACAYSERERHV